MTVFQVQVATRTQPIPAALRDQLLRLRKGAYKAWWDAAVTGLSERVKQQFIDRWQKSVGTRYFSQTVDNKHWKQAATNIIELDTSPERYLDVAFECHPKSMKWPTPRYLASDYLKELLPAWAPPEERQAAAVIIDGEDLAVVLERSQKQIEAAQEANQQAPTPHMEPMYFKRNWPGLYGKKDNKRVTEGEDG